MTILNTILNTVLIQYSMKVFVSIIDDATLAGFLLVFQVLYKVVQVKLPICLLVDLFII